MRGAGEDETAEGLALVGRHAGLSIFDFRFSTWRSGGCSLLSDHWRLATGRFCFEFCGLGFGFFFGGQGVFELDAEEAAGLGLGGAWAVDAANFGEEGGEGGEAVGEGVGFGKGGKGGEFVDSGNAHFAQAGGEGDLAGAEEGAGPEADGLAFFAGLDEFDEMAFEEEHGC